MPHDLDVTIESQGGVVTTAQLLTCFSRSQLDTRIQRGDLIKVWPGIYCREEPDDGLRLCGLDSRRRSCNTR